MFDAHRINLARLNTLTKYPSISNYHQSGDRGRLTGAVLTSLAGVGQLHVTEKVDGVNARILACPDGRVIVGSREELLWERDDLIHNPMQNIVETLRQFVSTLICESDRLQVYFVEVYGKDVGAAKSAKQYSDQNRHFRLFDAFALPVFDAVQLLDQSIERIALWRDEARRQPFATFRQLKSMAEAMRIDTVPDLGAIDSQLVPTDLAATLEWLDAFGETKALIDPTGQGTPEGVVLRTADRRTICKLRRADYQRSLQAA